jgi:hypothetical protein
MIRRFEVLRPRQQAGELRGVMDQDRKMLGTDPQVGTLVSK